jgi:hypothetical protein
LPENAVNRHQNNKIDTVLDKSIIQGCRLVEEQMNNIIKSNKKELQESRYFWNDPISHP